MVQSGKLLKHYNSFILLLLVLVVSDVALAQSQQQSVSQPQLYKVGESQLKVFLVKVFRSRLYSDNGKINDQTQWIHLQLTYQRNFKARQLVSQTDKEWQKQGYDNTKRSQWLEYINQLWPNVNKGDQISFQYNQHSGESRFFFNQTLLTTFNDLDFAQAFAGICLATNTSYPKHRRQLMNL